MEELKKILGLNNDTAKRLKANGYEKLSNIANADPIKLRTKTWLPEKKVIELMKKARKALIEIEFEKEKHHTEFKKKFQNLKKQKLKK